LTFQPHQPFLAHAVKCSLCLVLLQSTPYEQANLFWKRAVLSNVPKKKGCELHKAFQTILDHNQLKVKKGLFSNERITSLPNSKKKNIGK